MFPRAELTIYNELNLKASKEFMLNSNPTKKECSKSTSELTTIDLNSKDRISNSHSCK